MLPTSQEIIGEVDGCCISQFLFCSTSAFEKQIEKLIEKNGDTCSSPRKDQPEEVAPKYLLHTNSKANGREKTD